MTAIKIAGDLKDTGIAPDADAWYDNLDTEKWAIVKIKGKSLGRDEDNQRRVTIKVTAAELVTDEIAIAEQFAALRKARVGDEMPYEKSTLEHLADALERWRNDTGKSENDVQALWLDHFPADDEHPTPAGPKGAPELALRAFIKHVGAQPYLEDPDYRQAAHTTQSKPRGRAKKNTDGTLPGPGFTG